MSEDPIRVLIEKLEEDWRSSHPVTLEDLLEDLIGTLDTYLSRPSNEDLLQKLYDLCFVRIDKEAVPGLDAVHEASRDLVAVGYDPAHVAPVAAVIFANLLEVLLAKWWRDLGEDQERREQEAMRRLTAEPPGFTDSDEMEQ